MSPPKTLLGRFPFVTPATLVEHSLRLLKSSPRRGDRCDAVPEVRDERSMCHRIMDVILLEMDCRKDFVYLFIVPVA